MGSEQVRGQNPRLRGRQEQQEPGRGPEEAQRSLPLYREGRRD